MTTPSLESKFRDTLTRWRRTLADADTVPPLLLAELVSIAEQHTQGPQPRGPRIIPVTPRTVPKRRSRKEPT